MKRTLFLLAPLLMASAEPALAYVGPGAGISLLGSVIGLFAAVATALGIVIMMPLRAARRKARAKANSDTPSS